MNILQKILVRLNAASRCDLLYRICRVGMHLTPWRTDNSCLPGGLESLHAIVPDCVGSSVRESESSGAPCDCDVEVIVPCYNVERWVKACIDSILAQKTRFRFFCTIVNDGSTDGTRSVLKYYEGHPMVRIIDQENRGISGARNTGLDQRHGRYIMFVDSDDLLLPGAIEALMTMAEKTGADIVDSAYIRFADDTQIGIRNRLCRLLYNSRQRSEGRPRSEDAPAIFCCAWGKVYKTSFFRNVCYPERCPLYEDWVTPLVFAPLAERMAVTDAVTTAYRMRATSICHISSTGKVSLYPLYVFLRLLKDRDLLGVKDDAELVDFLVYHLVTHVGGNCVHALADREINTLLDVFRVLLCDRFAQYHCLQGRLRFAEALLRAGDYRSFKLWAYWHA